MLVIQTDDLQKARLYTLRITVYNEDYQDGALYPGYMMAEKDFSIEIIDYCVPTSISKTSVFNPNSLVYTVADVNDA